MNTPVWVAELAGRFWSAAGPAPSFPRNLAGPVGRALPLRVVHLHGLTLAGVRGWLARAGVPCPTEEPDRPLRACLVMRVGHGFAFVDTADPPDEQRFSLAHEVAHFLRDADAVRRAAVKAVGAGVLDVLDGKRPATTTERLQALLRGVPVAAHVHLLRRDETGRPRTMTEREAEAAADRLAFELLAPAEHFDGATDAEAVRMQLVETFGFPPGPAFDYAGVLCPPPPLTESFVERLQKAR